MRVTRAGLLALSVTTALAGAASAAYQVVGRRTAHAGAASSAAAPAALTASVSSPSVVYGGSVRVSGLLGTPSGVPLPGRSVEVVVARADSPSSVAVVATPVTDVIGAASAVVRPAAGSLVWLRWPGDASFAPVVSPAVPVAVASKVTLGASTRAVGAGTWAVTLRGTVAPAPSRAGERVRIERRFGTAWRLEATPAVRADGTFTYAKRHTGPRTYAYRVVRRADAAFAEARASYDLKLRRPVAPALPPVVPGRGAGVGPARMLVTGDSLAYYLGQQLATARGRLVTSVESRPSTGLARPDYFDWTTYARQQVAAAKPDAVVAFVGANDCQPLRTNGNGAWVALGTRGWSAEYQRRAAALMRVYATEGVREGASRPVWWLGLPIPREADVTACYRALNAATAAAAREVRGVTWVDTWDLYAVNGRYSDYVGGVLARQEDGIHVTFAGMRLTTRRVLGLVGAR